MDSALFTVYSANAYRAPIPLQLLYFSLFNLLGLLLNLGVFKFLTTNAVEVPRAVVISFLIYASFQAGCVSPLLFRKHSRWTSAIEPVIHGAALVTAAVVDFSATATLADIGFSIHTSKTLALLATIFYLYYWYRFIVYSAKPVYGS